MGGRGRGVDAAGTDARLAAPRARVLDKTLGEIRGNRQAFARVAARHELLAEAGNVIDVAASAARALSDAELEQIVVTLAQRKGPVSDALSAAARDLHAGQPIGSVVRGFLEALGRSDRRSLQGGRDAGEGGAGDARGPGAAAGARGADGAADGRSGGEPEPLGAAPPFRLLDLPAETLAVLKADIARLTKAALDEKATARAVLGRLSAPGARLIEPIMRALRRGRVGGGDKVGAESFVHVLSADAIRHSWNRHGADNEARSGNIPLSREDFLRIPEILADPTSVSPSAPGAPKPSVIVSKVYGDGTTFVVEQVWSARRELNIVTMWKKAGAGDRGTMPDRRPAPRPLRPEPEAAFAGTSERGPSGEPRLSRDDAQVESARPFGASEPGLGAARLEAHLLDPDRHPAIAAAMKDTADTAAARQGGAVPEAVEAERLVALDGDFLVGVETRRADGAVETRTVSARALLEEGRRKEAAVETMRACILDLKGKG